jgi:hypothetical protein
VAALVLSVAPPVRADATASFARFTAAWGGRSPAGVVALMSQRPEGRLTLSLPAAGVNGIFKRAQAQQTLKAYFARVTGIVLKDVTPRDHRDRPGFKVRTFDYTHRYSERDPVVTRMTVTFKAVGAGYELVSVSERPRP